MGVKQKPDGRWIAYWKEGGKGKAKYFGRGESARAQAAAWDKERKTRSGRKTPVHAKGPTFADLAAIYIKERRLAPYAEQCLLYRMGNFMPVFGHRQALRILHQDLAAYVEKRRRDGVRDSTIRREGNDIKAIFSFAAKRRPPLIPHSPARDFQFPGSDDQIIIPPTVEEKNLIFEKAPPHLRRFIQIAWFVGARPGPVEILSIKWSQVSWDRRRLRIISARKGGPRMRDVPLKESFLALMRSWYEQDKRDLPDLVRRDRKHQRRRAKIKYAPVPAHVEDLHIVHFRGHRIKFSIRSAWQSTLKAAGITRRIRPYDLRHYFATRVLEAGGDIKALSQVMGSSPKTLVQHYQHVTDALAEKTVNLIPDDPPAAGRKSVSKAKKGQLVNLSTVRREMAKRG